MSGFSSKEPQEKYDDSAWGTRVKVLEALKRPIDKYLSAVIRSVVLLRAGNLAGVAI